MILFLAAGLVQLAAQDRASLLKQQLESNKVTFDYTCTTLDKVPVTQTGKVVVDGNCYVIRGSGLEIWCDGKTRWTVDNEASEVYIENSGGTRDFLANPAGYLDNVKDLQVSGTSASGTFTAPGQDTAISFKFTSIKTSTLSGSSEGYSFDTTALGSEWIITDLR